MKSSKKHNYYYPTRLNAIQTKAFTLVEILIVVFLVGIIAVPFTNMFLLGIRGSNNNTEHVIAYNLAREKIEEIKGLPFENVKSDYDHFRDVYRDRSSYDQAYYNEDVFIKHFTDIYSDKSIYADPEAEKTYKKLKELYPKAYLKPLELYPNDYKKLRRVTQVEEISESALPPKLKKVSVLIFNEKSQKIADLRTFVGKHK